MYPQVTVNLRVPDKDAVMNHPVIKAKLEDCMARLSGGRMLLRKSGTEPVIRVMAEAPDKETCEAFVREMVEAIRAEGLTLEA